MKPEYRTLDPVGTTGETFESIASLLARPAKTDDRTRSIGELARECDVTLRALRFYEGKGLLAPTRDGATRLYGGEDVRRLKLVLRLKRLGFSLVDIRGIIDRILAPGGGDHIAALLARVEAQVAVLEEQRREVDTALAAIDSEIDGLRRLIAD
jgi:DNA-binding transcriptional MerR regulator